MTFRPNKEEALSAASSLPGCPLCGSSDLKVHLDAPEHSLTSQAFGSSRQEFTHGRILRCKSCELAFSQTRPAEEDLAQLYREMDIAVYEGEEEGRRNTAQHHLGILSRYLATGSLLDVGCASGLFLHFAAEHGWQVTGVEPSDTLCRKAKTLLAGRGSIECTTLQQAHLPSGSFDAITLWDVLEHVPDPLAFLLRCRDLLKEGGYLLANVPDADSLQARLLGSRWPLWLPEHLNYFNRNSLEVCGSKAGFRRVAFGRRPTAFSIQYVLHRLAQHRIPGAAFAQAAIGRTRLGRRVVAIPIGELMAVWQRGV